MSDQRRLLITGSGGFIGQAVLRSAAQRYGAEAITLLSSRPPAGFKAIYPEFRDERYGFTAEQIDSDTFDTIIHLGGYIPKSSAEMGNWAGPVSNIDNTLHLLSTLPAPRRFVFASTVDVYAPTYGPISEASPTVPTTLYGQSKLFCEKLLETWAASAGVDLQILRIGHTYGPGEEAFRKLVPTVIRALLNGKEPTIVSKGAELRSLMYIDDVAALIVDAAASESVEGPLNLTSGVATSILSLTQILCDVHLAETGDTLFPLIKGEDLPTVDMVFDTARLSRAFSYEETVLTTGLRAEYLYFQALCP